MSITKSEITKKTTIRLHYSGFQMTVENQYYSNNSDQPQLEQTAQWTIQNSL